ncbi:MAG: aminopeptidase P N-terminal domain-containing protein [Bdellovibrionales bacterium]|nr:aminopeptidase P N-terminal domain-containing protein [Bdellovibrionales bacterium]
MVTRTFEDLQIFAKRRKKLASLAGGEVLVLFSGKDQHLGAFRADSHFVYLTGFEEPEACAVIRPGLDPEFVLFVRPKDAVMETWEGYRHGPEGTKDIYACDQSFSIHELSKKLPELLKDAKSIYFDLGKNPDHDRMLLEARRQAPLLNRRSGQPPVPIRDPKDILAPLRVIKSPQEIEWMREACQLSVKAHQACMKMAKPDMNEKQIHGCLMFHFFDQLAQQEAYSSIVASGPNATVLHYRDNNRVMEDGDLLLIDAGAQKYFLNADITRTFPVNGKFTEPQKQIYQSVLDCQKKLIPLMQPGFSLVELQDKAIAILTEALVELNLLSGSIKDLIADKKYQKYYPHGIGHYLGMDVHDVGLSKQDDKPVPLESGMVVTMEPGLYIPLDDPEAPLEFRGIGVRIEDDVLITDKDPEVLTAGLVKEVKDVEALCQS